MIGSRLSGRYAIDSISTKSELTRQLLIIPRSSSRFKAERFSSSSGTQEKYDVVVVGGGIVGTAASRELLLRHPKMKMAIVEKECEVGHHQSGNNSGVIHAGIYYEPGSLAAKLCVEGLHLLYNYLDCKKIPYKKIGKLIVATRPEELSGLNELMRRGIANNVPNLRMIDYKEIKTIEPYCKGIKAIHSPETGIVEYKEVTKSYADDFKKAGGQVMFNFKVIGFEEATDSSKYPVRLVSESKNICASYVIVSCGLQADFVALLGGCGRDPHIIPFRGEYLIINKNKQHLVKGNIYPVPDPRFPSLLGVHFTPRMDGSIWLGPNAVLALKREGYKWNDFDFKELSQTISYPGFHKLAVKYASYGTGEIIKSIFSSVLVKELQRYVPDLQASDVCRGPAGVRAQAIDSSGELINEFIFDICKGSNIGGRILHSRNAPSPGATASLAIGKVIATKAEEEFNLKSM